MDFRYRFIDYHIDTDKDKDMDIYLDNTYTYNSRLDWIG